MSVFLFLLFGARRFRLAALGRFVLVAGCWLLVMPWADAAPNGVLASQCRQPVCRTYFKIQFRGSGDGKRGVDLCRE